MIKKITVITSVFLSLIFVFTSIAFPVDIFAQNTKSTAEMGTIEEIISSYYDPDGRPMSCAHRAITYIGNPIPENSLLAIQDCIDHKVDIVELDIMRTSDGVFVLCHDSSIKRTTTYTGSKSVAQMTYAEICQYPLLQYTGSSRGVYYDENGKSLVMPTFEDALKLCKDNIMINLDKFTGQWAHRMELYELVRKYGCLDNVMFKGGYDSAKVKGWHNEIKAKYGNDAKMPNFCTLNSNRDATTYKNFIKAHSEAGTAFAVESGFSAYTQPQSDPAVLAEIRKYTRTFVNVLTESLGGTGYCAGHKENSTGWAEMIALGYNIMQTNNAADCAAYIYANYSQPSRDITQGIDMLYFTNYKHSQTSYTVQIQAPSVKLYNGDYIYFKNVDFSSTAGKSLVASITSHSKTGQLVIRAGSPSGDVIAKYDLSKLSAQTASVVQTMSSKKYTTCDLYVCAENTGSGYVALSKLVCADPKDGKITNINGLSVFTKPKTAPKLPSEVTVVTEYGYTYNSKVTWSPIPKACYSENLSYFTVPGVLKDTCEVIYATVTVLDLDMSGAARWYDSGYGVETNSSSEVLTWYDRIYSEPATASAGKAPTLKSGVINFDGLNDSMIYNHSLSGKSNVTMVINAKTDKKSTDYLGSYKINNTARYTLIHYPESGGWGSVWLTGFKNGIACRFGSGIGDNRGIYYTGVTLNGWSTVSAVKSKTSEKLYVNSSMVYDRAADTSKQYCMGVAGSTIENTHEYAYLGLGIQSSANYYYEGSVSDVVIFERALSDSEIKTLSSYFSAKNAGTLKNKSDSVQKAFDSFVKESPEQVHTMTCKSSGSTKHKYTCSVCSYSVTENHEFTYTSKDAHNHTKACKDCSYKTSEAHTFEKVSETPATDDAAGSIVNKCKECSYETVTEVPRIAYTLTLVSATCDKTQFYKGETVTVTANAAPEGMVFERWVVSEGVSVSDVQAPTATFVMSNQNAVIEAKYTKKLTPVSSIKVTVSGYEFLGTIQNTEISAFGDGITLKKSEWFEISDKETLLGTEHVFDDAVVYKVRLTFDLSSEYTAKDLTASIVSVEGSFTENVSVDTSDSVVLTITLKQLVHEHVFDQKTVDPSTLKSQADCTHPDVYYFSCICHEISDSLTFEENEPLDHQFKDECDNTCEREGCSFERKAPHVPCDKYEAKEGFEGHGIYCEKCNYELEFAPHEYESGKCKVCGLEDPDKTMILLVTVSATVVVLSAIAIIIILILKKKKTKNN